MKDYAQGPVSDDTRKCTDIFCVFLFIFVIIGMLGVAIYAWMQGNFNKLNTPYDPDGKGCGVDYPQYPYIYFASPHHDSLWVTVCVSKCPVQGDRKLQCKANSKVGCEPVNNADNEKAVQLYDSFPLGPVCMPSSNKIQSQLSSVVQSSSLAGKFAEIGKSWKIILLAIPISIVFSLIFMLVMRFMAGIFVYLLFITSILIFLGFGIYLVLPQNNGNLGGIEIDKTFLIIIGAIFILIGTIILFIMICYRRRVALAATMTRVSARFVQQNCLVAILPIFLFAFMILYLALWIVQGLGYYSLGIPQQRKQKQLPFQHFEVTTLVEIILLIHIFHLLWAMFFFIETGDFIISGTATSWYFKRQNPFEESRHRFMKYHSGSVIMGSFLMALLGFIKFLYQLFHTQQEEEQGVMGCIRKCCNCFCYLCVAYLFNWFNNGAYTYIHLAGDSYCTSACEVASLRIKQPLATAIVAFMEALFSILVKLGITAATCSICAIMIKNVEPYKNQISDSTAPLIVIGIMAYVICSFFVSLYSEAMQAIYVCFLADSNAGGHDQKAPGQLLDLLAQVKKQNHFVE